MSWRVDSTRAGSEIDSRSWRNGPWADGAAASVPASRVANGESSFRRTADSRGSRRDRKRHPDPVMSPVRAPAGRRPRTRRRDAPIASCAAPATSTSGSGRTFAVRSPTAGRACDARRGVPVRSWWRHIFDRDQPSGELRISNGRRSAQVGISRGLCTRRQVEARARLNDAVQPCRRARWPRERACKPRWFRGGPGCRRTALRAGTRSTRPRSES